MKILTKIKLLMVIILITILTLGLSESGLVMAGCWAALIAEFLALTYCFDKEAQNARK